jgi:hypothetical protein
MEKLEITIEILETKELSSITTIIGNCGMGGVDTEALWWHISGCSCSCSCSS